MLRKLSEYVQQLIVANYNKMDSNATIDDAAFFTFLIFVEKLVFLIFLIVASVSLILFTKHEIYPIITQGV